MQEKWNVYLFFVQFYFSLGHTLCDLIVWRFPIFWMLFSLQTIVLTKLKLIILHVQTEDIY